MDEGEFRRASSRRVGTVRKLMPSNAICSRHVIPLLLIPSSIFFVSDSSSFSGDVSLLPLRPIPPCPPCHFSPFTSLLSSSNSSPPIQCTGLWISQPGLCCCTLDRTSSHLQLGKSFIRSRPPQRLESSPLCLVYRTAALSSPARPTPVTRSLAACPDAPCWLR